jgi:hypothetical protein
VTRHAVRLLLATQVLLFLSTSPHAANALLLPAVDTPTGGSGSVVLEPVKPRTQPTTRLVYSCVAPGLVTFSDRPCGPLPEVRELKLSAPEPVAAGAAPELGKAREPAAAGRRNAPGRENADPDDGGTDDTAICQKLQATLDNLDSRMRTGYSAREAGRLWERWREAKVRLREANC